MFAFSAPLPRHWQNVLAAETPDLGLGSCHSRPGFETAWSTAVAAPFSHACQRCLHTPAADSSISDCSPVEVARKETISECTGRVALSRWCGFRQADGNGVSNECLGGAATVRLLLLLLLTVTTERLSWLLS